MTLSQCWHGVWKSQKKSHSILRAKWARFTFWVDKSFLKMSKKGQFWRVFENLKLAVKNSVTRQVSFNRTTIGGKGQNSKIQMWHFGWFSNTVSPPLRHQKRFLVDILVLKRGDVGKGWPSSRHVSSCSPTESQCAESPEYRILIERGWRWHWIGVQTGQPCPFVKLGKLQCRFLKEASTHFKAN